MPYARARRVLLLLIATLLLAPAAALADGFIIVHEPHVVPGHFPFAPLEVSYHRVKVEIEDRVAVTSVDQEFRNPGSQRTEGTYMFPLPPGAHIDSFSMDVNGKMTEAELLPAEKARSIYEEIVRKTRDPALLEYVGRDAFRARIFPIEAHGTKRIKIKYTQVLEEDASLVEYVYPLNTEKFSSKNISDVSVHVKVKSERPIKSIYCPSHEAEVKRKGDNEATVGYEEKNARPDTDFKLLFSREQKDVDIKLLTYRKTDGGSGGDGYFMLMASPGAGENDGKRSPKDIVFVADTSGSMAERDKIGQLKKALNFCLANLNEEDRFNIVRFSTEAEPLFAELEHPTDERLKRARDFVEKFKPTGGTAIDDALKAALEARQEKDRPFLVVFLTDGAPTIGTTDEDEIVKHATDRADDVRVFCFGVGHDVNTHLLDRIADATRAASTYILPDEDIEVKVSSFYAKVKEPAMTDLKVTFGGGGDVRTSQLYPAKLPDLFKGDTLLLFGRYSGEGGAASVKITGTVEGKEREFAEDVKFAESDTSHAFIPRLWATRRVGWLLDEIRLRGESKELKDEVVKLAREHGIVTPYTAYLIMEDESGRNVPELSRTFRELERDRVVADAARDYYGSVTAEAAAPAQRQGQQAVANAQEYQRLKFGSNEQQLSRPAGGFGGGGGGGQVAGTAGAAGQPAAAARPGAVASGSGATSSLGLDVLSKSAATAPAADVTGYRVARNYAQQARIVNGKAFYQNGNTWTDADVQKQPAKRQRIRFNSDEYFNLARANAANAQWLSLGSEVDVVIGDTLYEIREN